MTRIGMRMACVFSFPFHFFGLMFIAFGIMEVGLLAARSHVLFARISLFCVGGSM